MSIFDSLRNKSSRESKTEPIIDPFEPCLSASEFLELAKQVARLDLRVEWQTIFSESAGGRLQRSIDPNQSLQCILRPLKNKRVRGLVFDAQVAAVPPQNLKALQAATQQMSLQMSISTGSEVYIADSPFAGPSVLWFKTITSCGSSAFTDEALLELIESNFVLAEFAFRALAGIHQQALSIEGGIENFVMLYHEYLDELPTSLQQCYRTSRDLLAVVI